MLRELHIKNYAIIDEVSLQVHPGFNVITGETGAGKSILVNALSLILGERTSLEGVRHGSEEAILEASFDPVPSFSADESSDLECSILKRVIVKSGKNRAYLNGSLSTLSALKETGRQLVEIHGQQGQHLLTDMDQQRMLLDAFCQGSDERALFNRNYKKWSEYRHTLEKLTQQEIEANRTRSNLEYELQEIRSASMSLDEEAALEREEHALKNWESVSSYTQSAYSQLSDEGGILAQLDNTGVSIKDLNRITDDADTECDLWEQSKIQLKELAAQLRTRLHNTEFHPKRLEEVATRLYQIQRLKKKYQRSVKELLDYQGQLEKNLLDISDVETRRQEIEKQTSLIEKELLISADALSKKRADGIHRLIAKVKEVLNALGMEKTTFEISHQRISLSENGIDRIEFLVALPGEIPRSLAKIASGGELSRIMLALKVALAEVDPVPTLVFDEVDAGIGGAVTERVGRCLYDLSKKHQVLCITHLPQIASLADHHYHVEKIPVAGRLVTSIKHLSRQGRVEELARMLGGVTITPITRRHAEEMMSTK